MSALDLIKTIAGMPIGTRYEAVAPFTAEDGIDKVFIRKGTTIQKLWNHPGQPSFGGAADLDGEIRTMRFGEKTLPCLRVVQPLTRYAVSIAWCEHWPEKAEIAVRTQIIEGRFESEEAARAAGEKHYRDLAPSLNNHLKIGPAVIILEI